MVSPEPSFEGIFNTQKRPSAQSSFDNYTAAVSGANEQQLFYAQQFADAPMQYAEEPQSLEPRDHRLDMFRQDNGLRKDSVPFDPTSSSTLIASVAGGPHSNPGTPAHYHYEYAQQQQAYMQQQHAAMNAEAYSSATPSTGDWNNDMRQQQQEAARRASFNGGSLADPHLEELQRIISNASSHGAATPGDASRAASPFLPHEQSSAVSATFPDAARSPSPFVAAPSPPVRPGSTTGLANKPCSPPALVIPNSAPSPQYQPMAAIPVQAVQSVQQTGQYGNSLLPPANPALTGMAGISPIADNADGPMICIQPSTPISGLKENNGNSVFDAELRRANAQAQVAQANAQLAQGKGVQAANMSTSQAGGADGSQQWGGIGGLAAAVGRPRSKSESYSQGGEQFDRQALQQAMQNPALASHFQQQEQQPQQISSQDQWINAWRMNNAAVAGNQFTVDPRQLPGQGMVDPQFAHINTAAANAAVGGGFESGNISPTSMAVYQQLGLQTGGNVSTGSQNSSPGFMYQQGIVQPVPQSHFLIPETGGIGARRRSFAEGTMHHAAGPGTPGYGVEFSLPGAITPPGRLRGAPYTHRRAVKSEDFSRYLPGTGWGVGQGGSTSDFLQAITNPDDGTLLPPSTRGRSYSHSRHSSASSVRSASPALSVSSHGSSYSHHSHMDMPDQQMDYFPGSARPKVAKLKVTSMATEVASQSRRTNSGIFKCPVPGCGSTFTRHFNLKGHLRSHNDERPYKCIYEGCPKAIVGFARQHDCKRHMLLHEGLRPFECEGCGKKFARLDALTRHHKSEQGQECAISHPLPTNPDGTAMSESQYKAYQELKGKGMQPKFEDGGYYDSSFEASGSAEVM